MPEADETPSRWRRALRRPAVLFGLAGLAVTQPLLDLLGRNPEFFVAGNYSPAQIVLLALVVAVVPAAVAVGLVALAGSIHEPLGGVVHSAAVGLFAGLFGLVLVRSLGSDRVLVCGAAAVVVAAAVAVFELRSRVARLFLSYLAIANVLFVVSFVAMSPTSELVLDRSSSVDVGKVSIPDLDGPVVVIILDEFPLPTLLRADGTINESRYPNFARLANESTWFRNASSHHAVTHRAVPTALTGRMARADALPTYDDHPRNLLTLFGGKYPVHRYETVTDLCPPSLCDPPPRQSIGQALSDSAVVYGHRVLPARFRTDLPEIDHSWGNFGDELGAEVEAAPPTGAPTTSTTSGGTTTTVSPDEAFLDRAFERWHSIDADERTGLGQAQALREHAAGIDADPALHLIHVALPHHPWFLGPGGFRATTYPKPFPKPGEPHYDFYVRLQYQLHVRQVGATDEVIGSVIDGLERKDVWDDTTFVVFSDHGQSVTAPDFGRAYTQRNRDEVLRVPLFIKGPHQREGETRDEPAHTVDILPSLIDLLDIDTDWKFQGHSLYDGSTSTVDSRVGDVDEAFAVAARHARDFPQGDDWDALAAVGPAVGLVGRDVSSLTVGDESAWRWKIARRDLLANLPARGNLLPIIPAGSVTGSARTRPPELVVAINGRIAGVIGGYKPAGEAWTFLGYVANYYRKGPNELTAFEVERSGTAVLLHPVREVT